MKSAMSKIGYLVVALSLLIQSCTPARDILGNLAATQTAIALDNTWYVFQLSGNDTNDCLSIDTACKTIQGAMAKSRLFHNPTIMLYHGTYEFPDVSSDSGWREIDRDVAIISPDHYGDTELIGPEGDAVFITNNAHVVLDGIWIRSSVLVEPGSSLTLRNAWVTSGFGPGVNHIGDQLIIENSMIENNKGGGVITSGGLVSISGSIIADNDGAGITIFNGGRVQVNETLIYENHFYDNGHGEVHYTAGIDNSGHAEVYRSSIFNNHGPYAVFNQITGSMTLTNSTVSGNDITSPGGAAVYNNGNDFNLIYSTVAANHGLGVRSSSRSYSMVFENSLIANNRGGNCVFSGTMPILRETNLDTDRSCFPDSEADVRMVGDLLGPLELLGNTWVHALQPSNPAIDAATGDCPDTDQRGVSRHAGSGACDVGAFEAPPLETFTLPATEIPGDQIDVPTMEPTSATAIQNANCRYGPGTAYDIADTLFEGQTALVQGRNEAKTWWQIKGPKFGTLCWVSYVTVKVNGDPDKVPIQKAPPLPEEPPAAKPQGCYVYDQYQNVICTVPCPPNPQPGGACTP